MIARTETARAQTTGTLQAYANYGVKEIDVIHSDDGRVCKTCLENKAHNPHPIKDSIDLCPAHPNCRCAVSTHIKHGDELKPQDNPKVINITSISDEFLLSDFAYDNNGKKY